MTARRARWGVAASLVLAAACSSTPDLYEWGPYEGTVYALCTDFTDEGLLAQLAALNEHVDRLYARDLRPAPGVHAQLGYLEYLAGNSDAAARNFEAEKDLYVESRVFMDRLLARMRTSG